MNAVPKPYSLNTDIWLFTAAALMPLIYTLGFHCKQDACVLYSICIIRLSFYLGLFVAGGGDLTLLALTLFYIGVK